MTVGDYVRTERYIGKIIQMIPNKGNKTFILEVSIGHCLYIRVRDCDVLKFSSRIFKVINKDDYVNGLKVIAIDDIGEILILNNITAIREESIYSVVTKEQFESVQYEVC